MKLHEVKKGGKKLKFIRKKLFLVLGSILVFLVLFSVPISAAIWENAGEKDTVEFLTKYQDYLSYGNFLTVMFNSIGWLLIKGLFLLTNVFEGLLSDAMGLLNFLDDAGLKGIAGAIINDLVVALMVLTLVFLGFKTVIAKEPPNFKSVGVNIAFSAFLILGLPTLLDTMENVSVKFFDATQSGGNNEQISSLSWNLIQENTTDLLYVSSRGFSLLDEPSNKSNGMTPDSFKIANLNALITSDTVSDAEGDEIKHLAYKLDLDENGETIADEIKGSAFGFLSDNFDEGYFRYESKFIPIFVGLVALMVAYLFTLFVFITTIIEIGFKQIVGLFVFATDLESGQRTKMVVQDILNAFMLIGFTGLSLKMYVLFLTYLGKSDTNLLIYVVAIVSATFVLIKGSSTIMRYFGVDVGMKEGIGQLAGAFAVGRATAGGVKKLNNLSKNSNNGMSSPTDEARENLRESGANPTSINDAPTKSRFMAGADKKGVAAATTLNENLQGNFSPVQASAGNLAMAGLAGATLGATQRSDQDKKMLVENQGLKEALRGQNAFSPLDKEQNVSGNERNQAQKGIQGAELQNGLQNPTSKNPEDLHSGLKGNHGETSINEGKTRSNQELLTNPKFQDDMQPNMKDSTGQMNMKSQMDGTPSGTGMIGGMKVANENHDAAGNLNMRTQATQSSLNEQGDMRVNQNERLEADMKVNSPGINQRGETEMNAKVNVSDKVSPSMATQSADVKLNPSSMSQKGEMTADMKVNPSSTNASPMTTNATTQSVQRVLQQFEKTNFSNPESVKKLIIQQVQQGSFGTTDQKQNIVQEITKSSTATPQQAQQNVQQVLSTARLPQEAQNAVQRVIREVQNDTSQSPETLKTRVIQELEQASFGTKEPIKQVIMQDIQKAFSATPEQTQQNIKQVIQNAQTSGVVSSEQVQQTIKQVIDRTENNVTSGSSQAKQSGYFSSLFGEVPNNYPNEVPPERASRFDFIKTKKGATE